MTFRSEKCVSAFTCDLGTWWNFKRSHIWFARRNILLILHDFILLLLYVINPTKMASVDCSRFRLSVNRENTAGLEVARGRWKEHTFQVRLVIWDPGGRISPRDIVLKIGKNNRSVPTIWLTVHWSSSRKNVVESIRRDQVWKTMEKMWWQEPFGVVIKVVYLGCRWNFKNGFVLFTNPSIIIPYPFDVLQSIRTWTKPSNIVFEILKDSEGISLSWRLCSIRDKSPAVKWFILHPTSEYSYFHWRAQRNQSNTIRSNNKWRNEQRSRNVMSIKTILLYSEDEHKSTARILVYCLTVLRPILMQLSQLVWKTLNTGKPHQRPRGRIAIVAVSQLNAN